MPCSFTKMMLGSSSIFSPDNQYVGIVSGSRLTIIEADTMLALHVFPCVDKIDKVIFSPDSQYVLCGMFSRNAVQIFSIADGEWRCRVNEGVAGIVNVTWAPDSRSVLTESDFGLQMVVWSLVDSSSYLIASPKASTSSVAIQLDSAPCGARRVGPLGCFSDCNKFYAMVHRSNLHDHIGVYTTQPWGVASKFKGRSTDVAALTWSPCSRFLITADSPLSYMVHVYDLHGTHVAQFEAYKHALGLRQCVFPRFTTALPGPPAHLVQFGKFPITRHTPNSTGHLSERKRGDKPPQWAAENFTRELSAADIELPQLLAIGSFDGRVRLLSTTSWKCAHVLPLVQPSLMEPGLAGKVLCSVELTAVQAHAEGLDEAGDDGSSDLSAEEKTEQKQQQMIFAMTSTKGAKAAQEALKSRGSCYVKKLLKELPKRTLTKKQAAIMQGPPPRGVVWIGWSADATLLAARDATYPQCLWIWDAIKARLVSLLVQLDSIVYSQWRPLLRYTAGAEKAVDHLSVLAFSCGTSRVYFWSPDAGVTWADLPVNQATGAMMVVSKLDWAADGSKLLLQGLEGLCSATVFIDKRGGAMGVVQPPKAVRDNESDNVADTSTEASDAGIYA